MDDYFGFENISATEGAVYASECNSSAEKGLSSKCNGSTESPYAGYDYTDALQLAQVVIILVPITFGIVVVVGLIGNSLVVVVVLFNKQMRNTTNILIINLAVADLLFIIFCVPFTANDFASKTWPFGDAWCRMVQYLILVCAYMSVYTLVLMSFDRYLAVVHPISSMSIRNEKNTYIAISVMWAVICICCTPVMATHGYREYIFLHATRSQCTFHNDYYDLPAFRISFFLTGYVVPLALITVLYILMLNRLWGVGVVGRSSGENLRAKRRVTSMVIIVVVVFAVCWCPLQIILVLKSVRKYQISKFTIYLQIVSHILAYANSCVNPILYAFLSENFRKSFQKLIACTGSRSGRTSRRLQFDATDFRGEQTNINVNHNANSQKTQESHIV